MPLTLHRLLAGLPSGRLAAARKAEKGLVAAGSGLNLLRFDPTKTTLLRQAFTASVRRRFARLRRHVRQFFHTDVLGLKPRGALFFMAVPNPRAYEFATDPQKVAAFRAWLDQQIEEDIFTIEQTETWQAPLGSMAIGPWTTHYVGSAYKRGLANAYLASRVLADITQAQAEFIRSMMTSPERMSKVILLGTRAFEGMKGITSTMAAEMSRTLAEGLIDGLGVIEIGNLLVERVGLAEARALMVARTEIIHAHAEGQLDAFTELGVQELGLQAEWSTAGDDRVCPVCAELEGKVFTVEEARGKIPQHPNCRCSWLPAVAGGSNARSAST